MRPLTFLSPRRSACRLIVWSSREHPFAISPIVDYLRSLPRGKLTSLQKLLIVAMDSDAAEAARTEIQRIGRVQLERIEDAVPDELTIRVYQRASGSSDAADTLLWIDGEMDDVQWSGFGKRRTQRVRFRSSPLPPLELPSSDDPWLLAPYLAAARLRDFPGPRASPAATWPVVVKRATPWATAAAIAEALLADIHLHETEQEAPSTDTYPVAWARACSAFRSGNARAERIVLTVSAGNDPAHDRMKFLPAVLYAAHETAPVVPLRADRQSQEKVLERWTALTSLIEVHYGLLADEQFDQISHHRGEIIQAREAFQTALGALVPSEYLELIRLVRPRGIVSFSALPMEWLDVGGVPLGYLTKIANIRSRTLATDTGAPADLCAAYTSVVSPDLRPSLAAFRVLLVAPHYIEESEIHVNEFTSRQAALIRTFLEEEAAKGREIEIVQPRDCSRRSLRKLLAESWSLFVYFGHAKNGSLELEDGLLDATELPGSVLVGSSVFLIGCDTNGARNLSGSLANEFLRLGARGVFASTMVLPIDLASELMRQLYVYAFRLNYRFGDVLTGVRYGALWRHLFRFIGAQQGRRIRDEFDVATPMDTEPERFGDSWDELLQETRRFFGDPPSTLETVLPSAIWAGLALTFAGDLRARIFEF